MVKCNGVHSTRHCTVLLLTILFCHQIREGYLTEHSRHRRQETDDVWKPAEPLPEYTQHANYHLLPQQPECGVPKLFDEPTSETVEARIRGGHDARLGQYPWIVLIETRWSHDPKARWSCMGSIINNRYILTAQHCFTQDDKTSQRTSLELFVGDWDLTTDPDVQGNIRAPPRLQVEAESVIPHKYFVENPEFIWFDVALVRLANELVFNDFVKPICLPFDHKATQYEYAGEKMTQAGWGQTTEDTDDKPTILQKLTTTMSVRERCRKALSARHIDLEQLEKSQMCVDIRDDVKTCAGDSGTPLMYSKVRREKPEDTIFYVMGVHSFGLGPCSDGDTNPPYKVSTWVPAVLTWILDQVQK